MTTNVDEAQKRTSKLANEQWSKAEVTGHEEDETSITIKGRYYTDAESGDFSIRFDKKTGKIIGHESHARRFLKQLKEATTFVADEPKS